MVMFLIMVYVWFSYDVMDDVIYDVMNDVMKWCHHEYDVIHGAIV